MAVELQHDVGVHLDEAAVAVIGETLVTRGARERQHRSVVQSEVQHRIHHAGHRGAGARSHRNKQRIFGVAKQTDRLAPDTRHGGVDLFGQFGRIGLPVGVEIGADFGGDGEARRHGQAEEGHLGEVGALAAQQILELAAPFGSLCAEGIHPLRHAKLPDYLLRRPSSAMRAQPHTK